MSQFINVLGFFAPSCSSGLSHWFTGSSTTAIKSNSFFQIHGSEEVILTTLIVTRCRDLQKHTTYLLLVGYRRRQRKACNTLSIRSRVMEKVASCVVLCHCWLVNGRTSSPVKSLCKGSLPAWMEEKKNKENRLIQHHVYKKMTVEIDVGRYSNMFVWLWTVKTRTRQYVSI